MSAGTGMGISLTTITTDAQCPLGFIHTEPASVDHDGERTFIYISYVATAVPVDLAVGTVMGHATGVLGYADVRLADVPPNADPGTVVGVSQQIWNWTAHYPGGPGAADALFGFVQRTGEGDIIQLVGATPDQGLIASATAGEATGVAAVTDASFATASSGAAGTFACRLHCTG